MDYEIESQIEQSPVLTQAVEINIQSPQQIETIHEQRQAAVKELGDNAPHEIIPTKL